MPARTRTRRPRWQTALPVASAVLAAALLFLVVSSVGDDDEAAPEPTTTSTSTTSTTTTTEPPDAVPISTIAVEALAEEPAATYRIVYEVTENELTRTETVTVRRPYESLVLSDRDGELVSGSATSRTKLWTYLPAQSGWLVLQPELHRAAFDHRPLAAMATAVALGRAEEREPATHAGRDCRVFVTGQPLGTPGIVAPSDAESSEMCIDAAGLVLHERWQLEGTTLIERTATSVETAIEVDPASFDPSPVVEDAEGFDELVSTIAVPADEETLAQLRTDIDPPDGYTLDGTVLRAGSPDRGGAATTEIVRFWSNGIDLIEHAEIVSEGGVDLDSGGAVPVEVDGPETWFWPDFRASAIRTRLSESGFVELRGADPGLLVDLLDTLTRRSG